MRRSLVLLTLIVCGCGGVGNNANGLSSPFRGRFDGTWAQTDNSDSGNASVRVINAGGLSGTWHDTANNVDGTVAGSIDPHGATDLTVNYPSRPSFHAVGTLSFGSTGHLVGTLTPPGGSVGTTVDLAPAP